VRVHPRRAPLAVVFSDPQIALAGPTYAELTAAGTAFAAGQVSALRVLQRAMRMGPPPVERCLDCGPGA
jgi:pyruvate/2-oxoglutarate dehydrogenase complex dihydrolipoamide dehydrogenase (E3) component